METAFLYMIVLGCTPKGRLTEQHDVFFGIGPNLSSLIPDMKLFWPEAKGKIHLDSWQKITTVDGFTVEIIKRDEAIVNQEKLFFINLGGYKENDMEEYHYKILTIATTKAEAIKKSKQSAFYKHCGFKGATSHIDDKYGVDVDDIYEINDILAESFKTKFQIKISKAAQQSEDQKHIGYLKLDKIITQNL